MATNDYWIDIKPPRGAYGNMGLDTYDISPHLGGPHHRGHHSGERREGIPLFYTVDYGVTPVITDVDDYEIPDSISGMDAIATAGWRTPQRNLSREWAAKWGRPNATQTKNLFALAARNNAILRRMTGGHNPSREDEMDFNTAQRLIDFYIVNRRGPDNGNPVTGILGRPETEALIHGAVGAVPKPSSLLGDIIHAANSAASFAGKALALPGQIVSHIPIIGKPLRSVLNLNPVTAMGGMVSKIAHGERLDKAFLDTAKNQIANVREIAPYVQMVASVVPGVGTGLAAAMAAGVALSEGRTITDAVMQAAKNAVPGGAIGKAAFEAATSIAHGNNISAPAMNAALANLPPQAQSAAQSAIAMSQGKNARAEVLAAIHRSLPESAKKALDIGTALTVARNVQSHVVSELVKPQAIAMLGKMPIPPQLQAAAPKGAGAEGYKTAIGLLQHSGVTAHAIAAVRDKLPKIQQPAFDHGVKTYMHQFTRDTHSSLVRGGVVTRGNWRIARAGEQGVKGRLIKNGKITHGTYVRA